MNLINLAQKLPTLRLDTLLLARLFMVLVGADRN